MTCYLCQSPITTRQQVEYHHPVYKSRGGTQTAPIRIKLREETRKQMKKRLLR